MRGTYFAVSTQAGPLVCGGGACFRLSVFISKNSKPSHDAVPEMRFSVSLWDSTIGVGDLSPKLRLAELVTAGHDRIGKALPENRHETGVQKFSFVAEGDRDRHLQDVVRAAGEPANVV